MPDSSAAACVVLISRRKLFHITFRKLLQVIDDSMPVVEHHGGTQEAVELPKGHAGSVIVDLAKSDVDETMSGVLSLLSNEPEAHLLVVIDEHDDDCIAAAMNAGAMGVAIKSSPPQVLTDTLLRVLDGQRCRPAPTVTVSREDIPVEMRSQLSARQQKILRAIMGGQSISATATELGITPAKLVHEMRSVLGTLRGRPF